MIDSYGNHHLHQRGLCAERTWSADGETEIERCAYVRVRFVKTYDAAALFALPRLPADLAPYHVGLVAQVQA